MSWREQASRHDIEALRDNMRRVDMVIRVRWVLVAVLVMYSLVGALLYLTHLSFADLSRLMLVPAVSLGIVVIYNSYFARHYHELGNIAAWNLIQLLLDAVVVTILVYFSGGIDSWFWSVYSLLILEAAFILYTSRQTWAVAGISAAMLGAVVFAELVGLLPHVVIPFSEGSYWDDPVFVALRYLWQVAVLAGTAFVATLIVGSMRAERTALSVHASVDSATGLYSRDHFNRAARAELRRAARDRRQVHLALIDIDRFGEFNRRFGIEAGDDLLGAIAGIMASGVSSSGDLIDTTNLVARVGGEEFAIMLVEDETSHAPYSRDTAYSRMESLREAIGARSVDDASVTVSIGIVSTGSVTYGFDQLHDAADAALEQAVGMGGNRVIQARAEDGGLSVDEGGAG